MPRRRLQFRLVTLLAVIWMLSVLMVVGHWFGWQILCGLLCLAGCLGALGVTLLPAVVLFLCRSDESREWISTTFLVAGSLLLFHFVVLALWVEFMLRDPWLLDPNPFDNVMSLTLNWTVPAAAMGLLFGLVFPRRMLRSPLYWFGTTLTACGCFAFVWYGHYFFGALLGSPLAENVWWW